MSSLFLVWLYVYVIFAERVYSITTNTDNSQYVQIHSNGNQTPYYKSTLSPAQQTNILDDVHKNQRIHYHSNGPEISDTKQKSLVSPLTQTLSQSFFDQSHQKYANLLNMNSLSPPPIQTAVFMSQQSPPITPPHIDPLFYLHRNTDTRNAYSQFHASNIPQSVHELNPNQIAQYYQPPTAPNAYPNNVFLNDANGFSTLSTEYSYLRPNDSVNAYYLRTHYEAATSAATSSPVTTPSYHIKNTNNIIAPSLPKLDSIYPDKIIKEIVLKTNPEELISQDRQKFFQQLLGDDKNSEDVPPSSDDQTIAQNDLGIRNQLENEFSKQLKRKPANGYPSNLGLLINSSNAVSEFSLSDGKKIQISKDYNRLIANDDGTNKIKAIVIRQYSTTTTAPPTNLLEELTKDVVPAGTEFEVIKRNENGVLEEVAKLPANLPQKNVTFVILEEQSDGTVKVQGIRGSEQESIQKSGGEVDAIIRKIRMGELKLPHSTRLSSKQTQRSADADKRDKNNGQAAAGDVTKAKSKTGRSDSLPARSVKRNKERDNEHFVPTPPIQHHTTVRTLFDVDYFTSTTSSNTSRHYFASSPDTYYNVKYTTSTPQYFSASLDTRNRVAVAEPVWNYVRSQAAYNSTTNPFTDNVGGIFHLNNSGYISNLLSVSRKPANNNIQLPTVSDILQFPFLPTTVGRAIVTNIDANNYPNNTFEFPYAEPTHSLALSITSSKRQRDNITNVSTLMKDRNTVRKSTKKYANDLGKDNHKEESVMEQTRSDESILTDSGNRVILSDVLKKEGFFAMARFLRRSGLENILNDTGPFTLFIPTDKAFRTLLIQLGGPDKAEDKFNENPKLLSGLLLHHVIPGEFRVNTLQDEMTGVSLAGTQLRVNTYSTHDIEWNDILIVTVNGAKILEENDIIIPQGIAHAIDRVMFPLPVGNLLQSLQADRENRYSNLLKIIGESELSYLLTGGKTFTLLAPLNRAFTHDEFTKIVSNPNESKSFVLRHIVPGTLYSAGMKYYQVMDSMEDGQQITLYKEAGKIKVNTAHVITRNIPATNGVIHAIDAFL